MLLCVRLLLVNPESVLPRTLADGYPEQAQQVSPVHTQHKHEPNQLHLSHTNWHKLT
jgi:hypothetical protein